MKGADLPQVANEGAIQMWTCSLVCSVQKARKEAVAPTVPPIIRQLKHKHCTSAQLFSPCPWADKQIIQCPIWLVKYIQIPVSDDIIKHNVCVCVCVYPSTYGTGKSHIIYALPMPCRSLPHISMSWVSRGQPLAPQFARWNKMKLAAIYGDDSYISSGKTRANCQWVLCINVTTRCYWNCNQCCLASFFTNF